MHLIQRVRHKLAICARLRALRSRLDPKYAREQYLRRIWPNTLTIESSFACNLHCRMCPREGGNFSSNSGLASAILKPEVFERLLPSIHRFNHVHLTGWGEPLVNPHLLDYIRQLKERGREVSFVNNGTLLTEKISAQLLDLKLDMMSVSCDAACAETFEIVRGKGQFDLLVENLKTFCEMREEKGHFPSVHWIYVMMQSNLDELPLAVEIAGKLGVTTFDAKHLETALDNDGLRDALFDTHYVEPLAPEQQQRYDRVIAEARKVAAGFPDLQLVVQAQFDPRERFCLARPDILVVVDHEGNLAPCCYTMPMDTRPYQLELTPAEKTFIVGNVRETSLAELIASERYQGFLNDFRSGCAPETCKGCLQLCRRPAPAAAKTA